MVEKYIPTTCVWCGTGCMLYLKVKNGKVVGVIPSMNHPITRGRLCIKGWKSHEFIDHPDRLKHPLLRKNGRLFEVSWDEALDFVADKLSEIKRRYGPDSIAVFGSAKCTNEDNYVLVRFARAAIGTDNVDHCARLCHASTVVGLSMAFGSGAMTNSIEEIEDTNLILITGSNTSEQHPIIASNMIRAMRKGAKLIVVDPLRIPMARLAHKYLSPRPGTDIAWINGFINVIVNEGLHDREFINNHTEDFDKMWEVAKNYTPEFVERITGIKKEDLVEAARAYGKAERAMIFYAMGITQHVTGTRNVLALANLAMVTGNVGKRGTGVNPLRGQNNVQGASDLAVLPGVLPGYQRLDDPDVREKFKKVWRVYPPSKKGLASTEIPDAILEGKIKAIYIMGENPVRSHPDVNHIEKAFAKLDFLVVQDIFMNDTAKFAHVIFPAAAWGEKEGTVTNTDRRVQRVRKAVEPPGEAREDWWIIKEISKRMGYEMDFGSASEIFDEMRQLMPIYRGITYERIEVQGIPWPCPDENQPGTPYLHKDGAFRRKNGIGKFHPVEHQDPPELPDDEYPFYLSTGRVGFHWHTRTMTKRIDVLEREYPDPFVEISPEDASRLSIKDGDAVEIISRRGSVKMIAKISDRVPSGILFTTFHYTDNPANLLTMNVLDPLSLIPELKVSAVKIRKVT